MAQDIVHEILPYICNTWQLKNLVLLGEDSPRNNYVAQAYSELYQKNVVLKILLANTHELEMLKFYNGNGYVQLLDCDSEKNAFLLEFVTPGISLKTFFPERDEEATCIIAQLIKKLQSTDSLYPTHCFKKVGNWLKLLDTFQSEKIPKCLLQKAQILYKTLIKDMAKIYLLHGDLHSGNILLRQETNTLEWIAIDPHGVMGPLEYEVGRFIMNPIPELLEQKNSRIIIKKRIALLSKLLNLEPQKIIDWAFVQAILSACWCEEDGSPIFLQYFIDFAQLVESI